MPTMEKQLLLAKVEGSYGSAVALVGADSHVVFEPSYKLASTPFKRGIQHPLQRPMRASTIGKRQPALTFWQELRGNPQDFTALIPPLCHPFWQSCGLIGAYTAPGAVPTWTYSLAPGSATSLTMRVETDGLNHSLRGCRGDIVFEFVPGERAKISYSYQGQYVAHSVTGMVTPSGADTHPLVVESAVLQPFGDAVADGALVHVCKVTLSLRNNVYRIPDANAVEGGGEIVILGHGTPPDDMGIQLVMELTRPVADTGRWWDRWVDRELSDVLSITLGSLSVEPKQMVDFQMKNIVVDAIEDIVIGGLAGHKVTCTLMGALASTTEDDLKIVWVQA